MEYEGRYVYRWPRMMVTADAAVFRLASGRLEVLLVRRGQDPFKGMWCFPGGFVEIDEELEDAAARELLEETGLSEVKLEQVQTFGKVGRDPRGRQITTCFGGIIPEGCGNEVRGGDDAADAKWFDLENLPKLAFDHTEIAPILVKWARKKLG